ncbi:hypothetical protein ACIRPH_20260 [Nocardiopsis sp. NPDC101807]|uniref:hypothetical protein n=1 Tax=Nocardiopsis sp. NPDC101807 TaxID=3364339 RepID=UPI0037F2886C
MTERTVRFYEIMNHERERLPEDINFEELMDLIENLPESEAYVSTRTMELLGSSHVPQEAFQLFSGVPVVALDRITRNPKIRIERKRNYRPLLLDDEENLAEPTFFSIFPRNVMGVMRNSGSAPSVASIREYLNKILYEGAGFELAPLVDSNYLRVLSSIDTLTRVEIEVGPEVVSEVFPENSTIRGQLRALNSNLGSVGFYMLLKMKPKESVEQSESMHEEIRRLVEFGSFSYVERAKIAYKDIENHRMQSFDFLNESVAISVDVDADSETGQPTEQSVSQAMYRAYDAALDDIRSALRTVGEP